MFRILEDVLNANPSRIKIVGLICNLSYILFLFIFFRVVIKHKIHPNLVAHLVELIKIHLFLLNHQHRHSTWPIFLHQ